MEVFDHQNYFTTVQARIYNKIETIKLYHLDLLWKPLGVPLRFVFAETSHGRIVLMCSNLSQDPLAAIELYCIRVRIETMFDMLKNIINAFQCHFWSKKDAETLQEAETEQRTHYSATRKSGNHSTMLGCDRRICEYRCNHLGIAPVDRNVILHADLAPV